MHGAPCKAMMNDKKAALTQTISTGLFPLPNGPASRPVEAAAPAPGCRHPAAAAPLGPPSTGIPGAPSFSQQEQMAALGMQKAPRKAEAMLSV